MRTNFECTDPRIGIAIRRRKNSEGVQVYGLLKLRNTDLFLFDDERAYKPTQEPLDAGFALCNQWNSELQARRNKK